MQRLLPVALVVAVAAADAAGEHAAAFYLLLAAVGATALGALEAYGRLIDLTGTAPGLAAARFRVVLASLALALALLAAAVRAPALADGSVPALGLSALVGCLFLLLLKGVVGLGAR